MKACLLIAMEMENKKNKKKHHRSREANKKTHKFKKRVHKHEEYSLLLSQSFLQMQSKV